MSISKSVHVYTGSLLARLALASDALYPGHGGEGRLPDAPVPDAPVLHGVVVADAGLTYTYTRGDAGGLAEVVEDVVGDAPAPSTRTEPPVPEDKPMPVAVEALPKPARALPFDHALARRLREEGLTFMQIASCFGVSRQSAYSVASDVRINKSRRPSERPYDRVDAFRRRLAGESIPRIAKALGASDQTLRNFLRRVNGEAIR